MSTVAEPRYDRTTVTAGIMHFGVGNFHRSHQAQYIDRLLENGEAREWGICGVGVLPKDRAMRDALVEQDFTYTLVERNADGSMSARRIGSIIEYLFAPEQTEEVLERLADPAIRIVSLTVTEGGYNTSDVTGEFDADDPTIRRDLEPGAAPATVFGLVAEGLARRRQRGIAPFTVMSCDNLPGNGRVARAAFTAFARLRDPLLADWMDEFVAFPNSMVDRITPVTTAADRELVTDVFGVSDAWPVLCEPFIQWVLEDEFTLGRPPFENVGVQMVADVLPFELMKLRLLNASHQGLAYIGSLLGYRYAHEAASDPRIAELLMRYMDGEATPTLPPIPDVDLDLYKRTLIERFTNPYIRDTLARLATDASDRIPKFVLPVVHQRVAVGMPTPMAAAIVAGWAAFAAHNDDPGAPDRRRDLVDAAVQRQRRSATGFLLDQDMFGDLADQPLFADDFAAIHHEILQRGMSQALNTVLGVIPSTK